MKDSIVQIVKSNFDDYDVVDCKIIEMLEQRSQKGMAEYEGKTLDRDDFSLAEWLQHWIEEILDGLNYSEKYSNQLNEEKMSVFLDRQEKLYEIQYNMREAARYVMSLLQGVEPDAWVDDDFQGEYGYTCTCGSYNYMPIEGIIGDYDAECDECGKMTTIEKGKLV